jgi:hypothetical protein
MAHELGMIIAAVVQECIITPGAARKVLNPAILLIQQERSGDLGLLQKLPME